KRPKCHQRQNWSNQRFCYRKRKRRPRCHSQKKWKSCCHWNSSSSLFIWSSNFSSSAASELVSLELLPGTTLLHAPRVH
ncbi:hypothetical protein ACJX0J_022122, partial [Zea mays]